MGLFINKNKHPDVFKNNTDIQAPNQEMYKQDLISEIIEEQNRANDVLRNSLRELEQTFKKQSTIQANKISRVGMNVRELAEQHYEHRKFDYEMAAALEAFGKKNDILSEKVEQQFELQQQLANQMSHHDTLQQKLENQIASQEEFHQHVTSQISSQEEFQQEVISRLENQEALTEKMMRKLDHFRSILYERTHVLTEKIEDGYNSTSAYIYDLVSGSAIPPVRYQIKQNEKKPEK